VTLTIWQITAASLNSIGPTMPGSRAARDPGIVGPIEFKLVLQRYNLIQQYRMLRTRGTNMLDVMLTSTIVNSDIDCSTVGHITNTTNVDYKSSLTKFLLRPIGLKQQPAKIYKSSYVTARALLHIPINCF